MNAMKELSTLSIHQTTNKYCGFSRLLPSFDECEHLIALYLGFNSIMGSLPDDFLKYSDEEGYDIDLSNNQITGSIPGDWDLHI